MHNPLYSSMYAGLLWSYVQSIYKSCPYKGRYQRLIASLGMLQNSLSFLHHLKWWPLVHILYTHTHTTLVSCHGDRNDAVPFQSHIEEFRTLPVFRSQLCFVQQESRFVTHQSQQSRTCACVSRPPPGRPFLSQKHKCGGGKWTQIQMGPTGDPGGREALGGRTRLHVQSSLVVIV